MKENLKRKFKIYWITIDTMLDIVDKGKKLIPINIVPKSAKAVTAFFDPLRQCFGVIVYHHSFPELSEGEMIPDFREG